MKGLIDALIPPAPCLHCQLPDPEHLWLCEGCRASLPLDQDAPTVLEGGLGVESAFYYGGACSVLIPFAKNPVEPRLYEWLISQSSQRFKASALVPVPTHWRRRVERGGCHTTALSQVLSKRLNIPVLHALERTRNDPKQSQLDGIDRRQIQKDAFRGRHVELPKGKILLVDDVLTTGSTLRASAQALLRDHDVEDLGAWVLARRI